MHERGNRGKRACCIVCIATSRKRRPLGEGGSTANMPKNKVVWGCLTCDVALCPTDFCWDLFHYSKIGVV